MSNPHWHNSQPGGPPAYSFSGDGKLLLEYGLSSSFEDLVFLGLDRLMIVGYIAVEYRYGHFLLARFQTTPAGQPLNNLVYLPMIKR